MLKKPRIKAAKEATDRGRLERARASLSKAARTSLSSLMEKPWRAYAEGFADTTRLAEIAHRPLGALLEADAEGKAAWIELRRRKLVALDARLNAGVVGSRTFGGPEPGSLMPVAKPGLNVFGPPYDFQVTGPNRGDVNTISDRVAGTFELTIPWNRGGARWASASVGLALKAGTQGIVHVRPAWRYSWQGIASGHILDSHTEGAGRLVIQDMMSGAVLCERTQPLWNFDNDRWEEDDGYIDAWKLGADAFVNTGQLFSVTFLAAAMVADSGDDFVFGYSRARAWIDMRVMFVVVEMGP